MMLVLLFATNPFPSLPFPFLSFFSFPYSSFLLFHCTSTHATHTHILTLTLTHLQIHRITLSLSKSILETFTFELGSIGYNKKFKEIRGNYACMALGLRACFALLCFTLLYFALLYFALLCFALLCFSMVDRP